MYVLDTDSVIYFFKGMGRVSERLLEAPPAEVAVSAVTVFELRVGIAKSSAPAKRHEQLDRLLSTIRFAPFGDAEAAAAAGVRAELEAAGTPIGPLDNLIAGTARALSATLVTRNVKEFRRVEGLSVQSWY